MKTYLSLFDDAVELEIEVEYDAVYEPARGMGGPWEDSSPDESYLILGRFKVLGMTVHDDDFPAVTDEIVNAAWEAAQDRIEQECWDEFMDGDD